MKTFAFAVAVSTAVLVTFVSARPAHALGPVDLEIAAKAGYGSNDFGFGFGGRAGISFFGFYGGLSAVDYLGKSVDNVTTHTLLLGGELGFGIKISRLTIRPLLGLGEGIISESVPVVPAMSSSTALQGSSSNTSGSFYLEPGGLIQLNFGLIIFGVDAGCLILTSNQSIGGITQLTEAFTIHGQFGLKF
jgi:hypothetical protein